MNFLPKASGTRPRVACEIAPQGVAAARSELATAPLAAIAGETLAPGAVAPGLKPGNLVDRVAVIAALRRALEAVGSRPNTRSSDITLIVPDGATRVLLLDFDSLPNKLSEALPLVRFRLKKLLPFDADDAMVTFQVMSTSKTLVRVLAVAMPRDVLREYESAAREAGYEPGAVLPSTLAALAAVEDGGSQLVVNVTSLGITTAITRDGILLLHRTVDLQLQPAGVPAGVPPALVEDSVTHITLPLVSHEETAAEWAAQQPLPEHGRNPYATAAADAEAATQNEDGIPETGRTAGESPAFGELPVSAVEPGDIHRSPYVAPTLLSDLNADTHNSIFLTDTSLGAFAQPAAEADVARIAAAALHTEASPAQEEPRTAEPLPPADFANEIAQAISVAAAYFEDTLSAPPSTLLAAGSLNAQALGRILHDAGLEEADGLRTRDLLSAENLAADAATTRVPRSWLAGVAGALRG